METKTRESTSIPAETADLAELLAFAQPYIQNANSYSDLRSTLKRENLSDTQISRITASTQAVDSILENDGAEDPDIAFHNQSMSIPFTRTYLEAAMRYVIDKYTLKEIKNPMKGLKHRAIPDATPAPLEYVFDPQPLKKCVLHFLGAPDTVIFVNTSGKNREDRDCYSYLDCFEDFHSQWQLPNPCTLQQFATMCYKIKSHKSEKWYELFSQVLSIEKNCFVIVDFDHGS